MPLKLVPSSSLISASVSARSIRATISFSEAEATGIYSDPDSKNRSLQDTYTLGDVYAIILQKTFQESALLSDQSTKDFGKSPNEVLGISEVHSKASILIRAESLGLTEVSNRNFLAAKEDDFGVADLLTSRGFGKNVTESLATSDVASRVVIYSRVFADAFTLDDAALINKDYVGAKGNVFGFSDVSNRGVGKDLSETLGVTDTSSKTSTLDKVDVFGFSDVVQVGSVISKAEVLGLSESFSISHQAGSTSAFNNAPINTTLFNG